MATISNKIQRSVIKVKGKLLQRYKTPQSAKDGGLKRRQKEMASKSINKAILVVSVFPLAGGGG